LLPNWFHDFVGGTLIEHPHAVSFNAVPLLTSVGVALGGLFLGWLVYRRVPAGAADPLARLLGPIYRLLQNKYYFDELYDFLFVRPAYWFAETFVYRWLDRGLIDGILHASGRAAMKIGDFLRNAIDLPIINGFGDAVGEGIKLAGDRFRVIQTGRVQEYLIVGLLFTGLLLSYVIFFQP
jgi:NADH-quinone oxidoreductase subunit L